MSLRNNVAKFSAEYVRFPNCNASAFSRRGFVQLRLDHSGPWVSPLASERYAEGPSDRQKMF